MVALLDFQQWLDPAVNSSPYPHPPFSCFIYPVRQWAPLHVYWMYCHTDDYSQQWVEDNLLHVLTEKADNAWLSSDCWVGFLGFWCSYKVKKIFQVLCIFLFWRCQYNPVLVGRSGSFRAFCSSTATCWSLFEYVIGWKLSPLYEAAVS